MRIQQQLHRPPRKSSSISAQPIRSKSSGTAICPTMNPSRRTCLAVDVFSAVTFTSGLPALAMTNGSPLGGALDQHGQMSLGFVDIDRKHVAPDRLRHISPVHDEECGKPMTRFPPRSAKVMSRRSTQSPPATSSWCEIGAIRRRRGEGAAGAIRRPAPSYRGRSN
jgi:hypothetical protein